MFRAPLGLMMEGIILAGGRGTRLSSVVPDLPKPMAPVAGRPFLAYLFETLAAQGFTRLCLSTGYRAEEIERYFGASYGGVSVVYSREETPLGTGGAIRAALPATTASDIFVLNGDTMAETELRLMYAQHQSSADRLTIALTKVPNLLRYGAVTFHDGYIERFCEKGLQGSGYINAGTYLLRREIFDDMALPEVFSFEKEILMDRLDSLRPGVFLTNGYFIDIGVPEDYVRAQRELPRFKRNVKMTSA